MPDPILPPFFGNAGNNTLASDQDGRDLFGLGGDDRLSSAFDRTALYGGDGRDRLRTVVAIENEDRPEPIVFSAAHYGGAHADDLRIQLRLDEYGGAEARLKQYGGTGDDRIVSDVYVFGGDVDLYVDAGLGNDDVRAVSRGGIGLAGQHIISAMGGDDFVFSYMQEAAVGDTRIYGGAGDDIVEARIVGGTPGPTNDNWNRLYGGDGDDVITAFASAGATGGGRATNLIYGGDGDDTITASTTTNSNAGSGTGRTTVYGGEGHDIITVDQGSSPGNSRTIVSAQIYGGGGSDFIDARAEPVQTETGSVSGSNEVWGGDGADVLIADALASVEGSSIARATNLLDGGTGNDRLVATAFADPNADPNGAVADAFATNRLYGRDGADTLEATIADDGPGRNLLYGGYGADTLRASGGQDNVLSGGVDRDRIYASRDEADETLTGGSHIDTFYFGFGNWDGRDTGTKALTDFESAFDRLHFSSHSDRSNPVSPGGVEAASDVVDEGAGGDVVVTLWWGLTLVFENLGTGEVDSILDLVANPDDQFFA